MYMTDTTAEFLKRYPIEKVIIRVKEPFQIGPFIITAFAAHHSIHAPAVGYLITAGKRTLFYVPDLVGIINAKKALTGIDLYIGDGAIITRTLLKRTKNSIPTGHCPISEQLSWCRKYGVSRAIFTHCGSEIVTGDVVAIERKIETLVHEMGVQTTIAYDEMVVGL